MLSPVNVVEVPDLVVLKEAGSVGMKMTITNPAPYFEWADMVVVEKMKFSRDKVRQIEHG